MKNELCRHGRSRVEGCDECAEDAMDGVLREHETEQAGISLLHGEPTVQHPREVIGSLFGEADGVELIEHEAFSGPCWRNPVAYLQLIDDSDLNLVLGDCHAARALGTLLVQWADKRVVGQRVRWSESILQFLRNSQHSDVLPIVERRRGTIVRVLNDGLLFEILWEGEHSPILNNAGSVTFDGV